MLLFSCIALLLAPISLTAPEGTLDSGYLFPPSPMKCHSSSVVETPDGDLLACWFYGLGERKDDTLVIRGAWKRKGHEEWSEPFVMADSQDLPDCNPTLFIDPSGKLWLFWVAIQNNEWGAALLKYRTARAYTPGKPIVWEWQEVIHCRPRNLEALWPSFLEAYPDYDVGDAEEGSRAVESKLSRRLGWMTRTHPIMLPDGTMLLGLYSDVFNASLAASTRDDGKTWQFSEPFLGGGNIQPSFCLRNNGDIVSYMRDSGSTGRIRTATSTDNGSTWGPVSSLDISNPSSSVESIVLRNGHWLMLCNDTPEERNRLTAYLSDDEGQSWKWKRSLETDAVQASYPSVIQLQGGAIYCTYTYYLPRDAEGRKIRVIKWAQFDEKWIRED
jgi:predicted neuraminidase